MLRPAERPSSNRTREAALQGRPFSNRGCVAWTGLPNRADEFGFGRWSKHHRPRDERV